MKIESHYLYPEHLCLKKINWGGSSKVQISTMALNSPWSPVIIRLDKPHWLLLDKVHRPSSAYELLLKKTNLMFFHAQIYNVYDFGVVLANHLSGWLEDMGLTSISSPPPYFPCSSFTVSVSKASGVFFWSGVVEFNMMAWMNSFCLRAQS